MTTVPHIENVMWLMISQEGDIYEWAAEASPLNPNPNKFDCSELGQWAFNRAGATGVPDGSSAQWDYIQRRGTVLTVEQGIRTRGAALWRPGHIAWSLGDGTTIEARGRAYGVGTWSAYGRFQGAGLFPGVDYSRRGAPKGGMPGGLPLYFSKLTQGPNEGLKFYEFILQRVTGKPKGGKIDGYWGAALGRATNDFKKFTGLKPDGVASPKCLDMLAYFHKLKFG